MDQNTPKRRIFLRTLGCPKNEVDSSVMQRHLEQAGWEVVNDPDSADVEIINTCGFIEPTKVESLEAIWESVERKEDMDDGRRVIVTGCLAQRYGQALAGEIVGIDAVIGFDRPDLILQALNAAKTGAPACWIEKPGLDYRDDSISHVWPSDKPAPLSSYIKISDGCDNACRFCAIPLIRGRLRSRPKQAIVSEVASLVRAGTKEVILVAQDTTSWGLDKPGDGDLADLLYALNDIPANFWIRLMYAHPAFLSDRQIEAFRECDKMIPYLDMPLQHISDRMLAIMNRHITKAETQAKIDRLRAARPGMALRTTFIIGHPGETGADFDEMLEFAEANAFERMGAFPYSEEDSTPAARMEGKVPEDLTRERLSRLVEAFEYWSSEQSVDRLGSAVPCLMEQENDGVWQGRTVFDAPEIDGQVTVAEPLPSPGLYEVILEGAEGVDFHGRRNRSFAVANAQPVETSVE
ncbi:MAG: 30S ribosomal protein S12 methylthiotransferase RimO [candidate division Zixibacteria bacterium]|nr:30S ribosomal protein S12 methylthiotransferase RimO [candidate division Zixibacteria bacterium]